jgi:hypothetical protein
MSNTRRTRCDVSYDHIHLVGAGRERHCFLICRFAILGIGKFLRGRCCDHRIFKDADSASCHRRNFTEDVNPRLLKSTAILEHQILVFGLNRKGGNYTLIRLTEKVYLKIKIERVFFNNTGINRRRQVIKLDLRWST